ncbi:phenylacetaldoxime dehydratase [Xylariaceae sp. FL0016]|nr:phenylacetaldoxime dehydratase [Xylariaceae sp. FL0016]
MTEPSIPEHLRTERTVPAKMPKDYKPAFPSYLARYPESITGLVLAVFGAQFPSRKADSSQAIFKMTSFLANTDRVGPANRPRFHERASVVDAQDHLNETIMAYWASGPAYDKWAAESGFQEWWDGLNPAEETHGWFLEVLFPTMDRLETIKSHVVSEETVPEGILNLYEKYSGPIQEHGYWGSMRDRLPLSQTDTLDGTKPNFQTPAGDNGETCRKRRVRVPGRPNLAVIRSGQDWADTQSEERELYLNELHPVLIKGMDYLRDEGHEIGCYNCRLMYIADPETGKTDTDRTYGLAFFDELASLERWSREHPTHLDIFGGFFRYVQRLNLNIHLRLYHEVFVLKPEQQLFEYVGCHPATGMLTAVNGHPGLAK